MKKWKITSLLLFCLLIFCPTGVYAAESAAVTLELEYGFQGNVKKSSCFPVRVIMENSGEETEATLVLTVPIQADNQDISSSIWMNGSQQGNNKNRVYTYKKNVTLKKGETKTETFYLELPIFEGILYAALEAEGETLGEGEIRCNFTENDSRILVGIVSENPQGIQELDGMLVNIEQGYMPEVFVKTIQLKPEEIYDNPDALEHLDLLITDREAVFSQTQQIALNRWKSSGGFLLTREDEDVAQMFLAFMEGEQRKEFMSHLEQGQTYSFGETGGLEQVPVSGRPSMGIYLFILIVYILLAGPGIYLLLKKIGKQKYLWAGICALSVFFVGIISILGKKTSIHAPFISYAGLYEQQGEVWTENASIGIQAPYNYEYQLYLDNGYNLRPMGLNSSGADISRPESAEQVDIVMGEENYKLTFKNMSAFTQNFFNLKKNKRVASGETIAIDLTGDGEKLEGSWKNPTRYSVKNAILLMKNRAALLGDLKAGGSGEFSDMVLYSCGNEGLQILMREKMDFSDFQYPEYEMGKLNSQTWMALRNKAPDQAYLLGIVENPDLDFQENSGYKIFGSALIQIPVEVSWEKDGYLWCPNLEGYGENLNGEYSPDTNLMSGKEATVDYPVDFLGEIQELTLFPSEYAEEKYYFPFQGHVAFYSWEDGVFEEIHDWKRTLGREELEKYLSETGVLRVRYILEETLNPRERSCMLPCIQAVGKVEK
ncbi:MAG: hypothetical protein KH828_05335 [Clostridiales bacterium]|nr:hypothetical protein [Clostridiales bacterium]